MYRICLTICSTVFVTASLTLAQAQEPSAADKQFAVGAASSNVLEIRLGQYASANAASKDVKVFAEHMIDEHMQANDQLKKIASEKSIELPHRLAPDDEKTLERLEKLTGSAFDKAYILEMVRDHQKAVAAFEAEVHDGSQIDVKGFAEKMLPHLQHHLKMAEALAKD